ncbi:MAG: hypothetical protein D6798_14050, partial [Deltaproteobacteria bacterium]
PRHPGPFGRLAALVIGNPRGTLWITGLLCVLGLLLGSRLSVQPNILDMLPDSDPTAQAIRKLNAEEGGTGLLTIAIAGEDPQARQDFAQELADELAGWDDVEWVLYRVDEELAARLGALQLSVDELREIRTRLQGAVALGPAAQNPILASRLLDLGPLTERLNDPGAIQVLSGAGDTERVLVRPRGNPFDLPFSRPFMARVNDLLERMDAPARGVEIAWVGGPYRHSVEDMETIVHDLFATLGISVLLVVLFLALGFKRPRAVAIIFLPLAVGNIWTLGLAGAAVGKLNTFTSYFTALLIGLGVDFGIHLYSRYREERSRQDTARDAVIAAWDAVGPPCLTAAITSAAGFCSLWIAGFQGFQQLGTLLSGGVLLCLLAELVLLPLLLVRFDDHVPPVPVREQSSGMRPSYRLAPVGLATLLVIAGIALSLLPRVEFEYDISELRTEGEAYADLTRAQRDLAIASYTPTVVSYPDEATLYADHARISRDIAEGRIPQLRGVLGLPSVLPADQARRVELLQEIARIAASDGARYLPRPVQDNLARLLKAPPRVLTRDDLPPSIRQILGAGDHHHRLMLLSAGNMWDIREMARLRDAVLAEVGDHPVAGEYIATAVLFDLMKRDAPRVAGFALVTVFLASWFDLRRFKRALAAVIALTAGMGVAGAGMALTGLKLSMANFVGIPILMGIGIDVIIHLIHRIEEEGPGRVLYALRTTGVAAIMSAMTTIFSFASLVLASSQGVQGLGKLIVLGLVLVVLGAFGLVPLGWMTWWLFTRKR